MNGIREVDSKETVTIKATDEGTCISYPVTVKKNISWYNYIKELAGSGAVSISEDKERLSVLFRKKNG